MALKLAGSQERAGPEDYVEARLPNDECSLSHLAVFVTVPRDPVEIS